MADLHFELVTPEKLVRSETVHMVVVPGAEGDFGVLAGHAPIMSIIASNTQPHLLRSDVDRLDVGRDSPLLRLLGSAIAVRLCD